MDAPTEVAEPTEPAGQPMTPEQSKEYTAELTPNAALMEPFDGLSINTDMEALVSSYQRRASVGDGTPPWGYHPCSRHKSALQ